MIITILVWIALCWMGGMFLMLLFGLPGAAAHEIIWWPIVTLKRALRE